MTRFRMSLFAAAVLVAMAVFGFSPESFAADRKIKAKVPGIT